jgi:hypothetical protein
VPQLTHLGESADDRSRTPAKPVSNEQIDKLLDQMIKLPPPPPTQ